MGPPLWPGTNCFYLSTIPSIAYMTTSLAATMGNAGKITSLIKQEFRPGKIIGESLIPLAGYPTRPHDSLVTGRSWQRYNQAVRRACAVWLLWVSGFLASVPWLFGTDPQAALPTCCRTAGKHHCTSNRTELSDSSYGPSLRARSEKCQHFPKTTAAPGFAQPAPPAATRAFGAYLCACPASPIQVEARYRISFDRSCQKRGPPLG